MKNLKLKLNYSKGLNALKKIVDELFDKTKVITKKMCKNIIEKILNKTFKNVYVIMIKCDGKVIETAMIDGSEKDAVTKLILMNKKVNCQGNKNFEITKITPNDVKEMIKTNQL